MYEYRYTSEQYAYPVPVVVSWSDEETEKLFWKYFYLLDPPHGNFIHLQARSYQHESVTHNPKDTSKFWVNFEAISSIRIESSK